MNEQERQELSGDELFQQIDLFENYKLMPFDIRQVYIKWEEKIDNGLDYSDCEKFLAECESVGFTFQYELDANPFYLVPIDKEEQQNLLKIVNERKRAIELSKEILTPLSYTELELLQQYAKVSRERYDNNFGVNEFTKLDELKIYEVLKNNFDEENLKRYKIK